jgi:hypothetical protein
LRQLLFLSQSLIFIFGDGCGEIRILLFLASTKKFVDDGENDFLSVNLVEPESALLGILGCGVDM